jgi:uncharacterized protein (TIGR02246 family)
LEGEEPVIRNVSLLGTVLIFFGGCQPSAPALTQDQEDEVADSIAQLAHRLADTWDAGEEEAYLDCYLNDSTFTFAGNGSIVRGWAAFADTVRVHRGALSQSTVTYDQIFVDVLDSDLGVVTATFDWNAIDTAGTPQVLHGTYTTLMARTEDGWKVINVAESFPLEGM